MTQNSRDGTCDLNVQFKTALLYVYRIRGCRNKRKKVLQEHLGRNARTFLYAVRRGCRIKKRSCRTCQMSLKYICGPQSLYKMRQPLRCLFYAVLPAQAIRIRTGLNDFSCTVRNLCRGRNAETFRIQSSLIPFRREPRLVVSFSAFGI